MAGPCLYEGRHALDRVQAPDRMARGRPAARPAACRAGVEVDRGPGVAADAFPPGRGRDARGPPVDGAGLMPSGTTDRRSSRRRRRCRAGRAGRFEVRRGNTTTRSARCGAGAAGCRGTRGARPRRRRRCCDGSDPSASRDATRRGDREPASAPRERPARGPPRLRPGPDVGHAQVQHVNLTPVECAASPDGWRPTAATPRQRAPTAPRRGPAGSGDQGGRPTPGPGRRRPGHARW